MYMVMGLWLSGPEPQDRCTVVSVMSVTARPSGAPGGPAKVKNKKGEEEKAPASASSHSSSSSSHNR